MSKKSNRKIRAGKNNQTIWLWIGAAALLLSAFAIWRASQMNAYPLEVTVNEAAAKRASGAFILDVRQPEEWNEAHIPGSTLIPLGELAARADELPKDQEIVVVCRSGNRSAQGRDILLNAGFTQVTSMAGGLNQWKAAGLETVSGP